MEVFEGKFNNKELTIGIIVSRFNEAISKNLLDGALQTLRRHGIDNEKITLVWVPGAYELPLAAKVLAAPGKYDAIICLGCVIRGDTPHFEYVAGQAASGIMNATLETFTPIIFGVITTDTLEQAIERSGTIAGNKGSESAMAALEMADVINHIFAEQMEELVDEDEEETEVDE